MHSVFLKSVSGQQTRQTNMMSEGSPKQQQFWFFFFFLLLLCWEATASVSNVAFAFGASLQHFGHVCPAGLCKRLSVQVLPVWAMRVSSCKSEGGWRVKPCLFHRTLVSQPCERPLAAKATNFFIFAFSAGPKGANVTQTEMRLLTLGPKKTIATRRQPARTTFSRLLQS